METHTSKFADFCAEMDEDVKMKQKLKLMEDYH